MAAAEPDKTAQGMPKMQQPILESTATAKRLNRLWSQGSLNEISGFLYVVLYRPTRHVKLGFSLDPQSRRVNIGVPHVPGAHRSMPRYKTIVLAGMLPGKFADEISFHKQFKRERADSEWYSKDSDAVTELLTWAFDFPGAFYAPWPHISKYTWLLKSSATITWRECFWRELSQSRNQI